jgi:uncharacterized FlaG/YvyC family protein
MASEAVTGSVPAGLVHGSQVPKATKVKAVSGNAMPPSGKGATAPAAGSLEPVNRSAAATPVAATPAAKQSPQPTTATNQANPHALVTQLNKYLNDSGRPDQFRVDPASSGQTIQVINPSSGAVIGEYSAAQFPELARSLGVSGVLVDSHA